MRIQSCDRVYTPQKIQFTGCKSIPFMENFFADNSDIFIKASEDLVYSSEEIAHCKTFVKEECEAMQRLYQEHLRRNEEIFREHIFPSCYKIVEKLLDLPSYGTHILPLVIGKKPSELEYLYNLAIKTDIMGEMRIPGVTFAYFSEIPIPRLKMLERLILSKNDCGGWNYSPSFIISLDEHYNDRQIEIMSKLADCKVNGINLRTIAENPFLNHDKTIEKAQYLKRLYGKRLREIEFFSNRNGENYLSADIQLPHIDEKPDWQNFQRVFARLDNDVNPLTAKKASSSMNLFVDNIYSNLEKKLHVFNHDDLNQIITNILKENPETSEIEILTIMQKLTQFSEYSSLQTISEQLKKHNVERICRNGGINPIFFYLQKEKQLFGLSDKMEALGQAVFVTKDDLKDKTFIKLLKQANENNNNIVFINLEGWSEGVNFLGDNNKLEECTKKVLKKVKKVLSKNPEYTFEDALFQVLNKSIEAQLATFGHKVKTIGIDNPPTRSVIIEQMRPIMPSSNLFKSTVEAVAKYHASNDSDKFFELVYKISKYYDETLNVFSKQRIIETLKEINSGVNEFLKRNNIDESNVYIVAPFGKNKSFTLINKMYQDLYNIPNERKIMISDFEEDIKTLPSNAVCIILDDIAGTGASMVEFGDYMFCARCLPENKHILFCPITATKDGLEHIAKTIKENHRDKFDTIINVTDFFRNKTNNIDFIDERGRYGILGHGNYGMCTVFPYMAPDNDSTIASHILKYFLPDSKCIKNQTELLPVIEEKTYYYNIFGCDKEEVLSFRTDQPHKRKDINRVYLPKQEARIITIFKKIFKPNS